MSLKKATGTMTITLEIEGDGDLDWLHNRELKVEKSVMEKIGELKAEFPLWVRFLSVITRDERD